ncbi:MAG: MFS transporter [Actinomycetota bacterium]|nr:MFS transporter [Actinomycetota bacterium]
MSRDPKPPRVRLGGSYRKLYLATALSNIGDGMSAIAYPWLATAITRNPVLVAVVAAAQRLPWLVFTLPAGVITDRVDRRRAMVAMDSLRFLFTLGVAFAVLAEQGSLPAPDEVRDVVGTRTGLYLLLLGATLLMGCAEVLRDNCGQTIMPALVAPEHLERANGRMWAVESVANTFIGPPVGSLLLMAAFSAPFFIDAGSFFAAAALVALIPGVFRAVHPERAIDAPPTNWRTELAEGVRWLWGNQLLRAMAIILGVMNMATNISGAMFVLFAQDVLRVTPLTFTIMGFGFAVGGILGGYLAPWMSRKLGSGTCLAMTLGSTAVMQALVGISSWWPLVAVIFAVGTLLGSTWNVITVSLRQTIIPPHLLGRVNSVYRFFAWGMMPVGALIGGLVVAVAGRFTSHEMALRWVWFVDAGIHVVLFTVGRRLLTTERLERARAEGVAALAAAAPDAPPAPAAPTAPAPTATD